MSIKNLPIKIFKKRQDIDERKTEGGGKNELPSWALSPEELNSKSIELKDILLETRKILESRSIERDFIPAVLKVTLHNKALAKKHREEVGKIFNTSRKFNFVGMADEYDLLVKVDSLEDLDKITAKVSQVGNFAHGLSAIEKLDQFKPMIEECEEYIYKIKLINFQNFNLNQSIEAQFEATLLSKNVKFKKTKYTSDLTVFRVSDIGKTELNIIKDFEAIYSITPMPILSIGLDNLSSNEEILIKYPVEGVEYPIVGVLDSGIEPIPHLRPWLLEDSFSPYPIDVVDRSHGTFVAGIIIYGDDLQKSNWTGHDGCKLFSATVFPDTRKEAAPREDELIENITEAIKSRPDIKIWNLSLGLRTECSDNDFSDFGKFLDSIQEKFNILICKSAGNCENFLATRPVSKIPQSADSILSLVVGSIAHEKGINDMAEINYPSPFSRIGFGPNQLIKPDVSHYGGNAGKDISGKLSTTGVKSFSKSGDLVSAVGTSFSTPRITALTAGLTTKINEEFNPLLLKSLIIHSAKFPENIDLKIADKLKAYGYGIPANIGDILYNSENEITLILQDTLIKGNFYEILDFPFPSDLVDGDFYSGEITITLVSNPVLDNNSSVEYCQSNIDISFGTYDRVKSRDTNVRTIINEIGPDGALNLLNEARFSKRYLKNQLGEFSNERLLRNYGKKYHPVKKYSLNLKEVTNGIKQSALKIPKKWFLRLEGLYNSFSENQSGLDGTILSQEFCLIITIRDRKNNSKVYDKVTRLLESNNFIHENIQIRSQVKIENNGI